jgi:hypothetical protein
MAKARLRALWARLWLPVMTAAQACIWAARNALAAWLYIEAPIWEP